MGLDPARVNRLDWLVCAQNRASTESYADGTAPHGSAFLIGRVCGTTHVSAESGKKRYRIDISEYAHISDQPDVWEGSAILSTTRRLPSCP